jgi:NTE family protein
LKDGPKEVVVTVSNLSLNTVEYKSVNDCTYEDFCEWIWISCNYTPFMSLAKKEGCEYADGGFGSLVPIEEAINRGATEVDVIILETEVSFYNRMPSRNVFSLISNMYGYMSDRIEKQNIRIGKFVATNQDVILNFYYTPTVLTTNSLVFDQEMMHEWWEVGYQYARRKNVELNEIKTNEA